MAVPTVASNPVSAPASSTAPPTVIVHNDDSMPLNRHADVVDELAADLEARKITPIAPPKESVENHVGCRVSSGNPKTNPPTAENAPLAPPRYPDGTSNGSVESHSSSVNCMHLPEAEEPAQPATLAFNAPSADAPQRLSEKGPLPVPRRGDSAGSQAAARKSYVYQPSSGDLAGNVGGGGGVAVGANYTDSTQRESSEAPAGSITAGAHLTAL